MAFYFITVAKPFSSHKFNLSPSFSIQRNPGFRRNSLRINALSNKPEPSKVIPQGDRVLIRLEQLAETSAGGVLLPKSAVKFERYLMGEILSIGPEVQEVETGKKVLFSDIDASVDDNVKHLEIRKQVLALHPDEPGFVVQDSQGVFRIKGRIQEGA